MGANAGMDPGFSERGGAKFSRKLEGLHGDTALQN